MGIIRVCSRFDLSDREFIPDEMALTAAVVLVADPCFLDLEDDDGLDSEFKSKFSNSSSVLKLDFPALNSSVVRPPYKM
jgi:hypothetical protein